MNSFKENFIINCRYDFYIISFSQSWLVNINQYLYTLVGKVLIGVLDLTKGVRENNFVFIKLFAGLSVLMGHLSVHMKIPGFGYGVGTVPFYHVGVPFFLMLTAFFLYPSFSNLVERKDSIARFYLRRFLRIAPSIYFITIVTVAIFLLAGAISLTVFKEPTFWAYIVSNLFIFPVYHPDIFSHIGVGVLNGSLWTLFSQLSFYFMIPFIYLFEKKFGTNKMVVTLIITSISFYLFSYFLAGTEKYYYFERVFSVSAFGNLIYFAMGIFWAKYWKAIPKGMWMFILSIVLLYIIREDILGMEKYVDSTLLKPLWSFALSYATIWFGYLGPKIFRKFNKIEDIGMGIYIWHMVIINLFLYLGLDKVSWLNGHWMFVVIISITVILAYASRILVENPTMKLEYKFKKKPLKATT